MSSPGSHRLDVPGARLFYEVQGSGPALMLVGHPMGALGFFTIVPWLAEKYTVVTYDPRGFGRSTIDDSDQEADPELLADDARRVLEAAGEGPAHVFGSSGGAVTALALVAQYPSHVQTIIAHESPLAVLLPEADEARAELHEIYDTYRDLGIRAAWERFSLFTGMNMPAPAEEPQPQPPAAEAMTTSQRFFGHGLLPIALYEPDFSALQAASARIIVAGGTTSKGEFAQRTAAALAHRLDTPLIDFPGGHTGFSREPKGFAAVLCRTLA